MDQSEVVAAFRDVEISARERYNATLSVKPGRDGTVERHEARDPTVLIEILKEADASCPRAANTIRWLLWHEILDALWAMQMVELIDSPDKSKGSI